MLFEFKKRNKKEECYPEEFSRFQMLTPYDEYVARRVSFTPVNKLLHGLNERSLFAIDKVCGDELG